MDGDFLKELTQSRASWSLIILRRSNNQIYRKTRKKNQISIDPENSFEFLNPE